MAGNATHTYDDTPIGNIQSSLEVGKISAPCPLPPQGQACRGRPMKSLYQNASIPHATGLLASPMQVFRPHANIMQLVSRQFQGGSLAFGRDMSR